MEGKKEENKKIKLYQTGYDIKKKKETLRCAGEVEIQESKAKKKYYVIRLTNARFVAFVSDEEKRGD